MKLVSRKLTFSVSSEVSFQIDRGVLRFFQAFTEGVCRQEMELFLELTSGKKCLFDIGACFGVFSLAFLSNNPDARAHAFEPSRRVLPVLEAHRRLNPSADMRIHPLALSGSDGFINMEPDSFHLRVAKGGRPIPAHSLESVVKDYGVPDVIKLDVEGAEYDILQGAGGFFREHAPLLFLEIHTDYLRELGVSVSDLADLIHRFGYRFFDMGKEEIPADTAATYFGSLPGLHVVCATHSLRD